MAVLAPPSPKPYKILKAKDTQKNRESSFISVNKPYPAVPASIIRFPPSKIFFRPNFYSSRLEVSDPRNIPPYIIPITKPTSPSEIEG